MLRKKGIMGHAKPYRMLQRFDRGIGVTDERHELGDETRDELDPLRRAE